MSDNHETHISYDVLGQYVSRQRSLRKCQLCKHYIGDDEDENKYMRPFGSFIRSPGSLRVPIGPKELIRAKAEKRAV